MTEHVENTCCCWHLSYGSLFKHPW